MAFRVKAVQVASLVAGSQELNSVFGLFQVIRLVIRARPPSRAPSSRVVGVVVILWLVVLVLQVGVFGRGGR